MTFLILFGYFYLKSILNGSFKRGSISEQTFMPERFIQKYKILEDMNVNQGDSVIV